VQLNPHGEAEKQSGGDDGWNHGGSSGKTTVDLPAHEHFDLKKSDVLDEDIITVEPGIVFFEVGFSSLHAFFCRSIFSCLAVNVTTF
jgi:hypothetical protein